jgi:hypothetical protein
MIARHAILLLVLMGVPACSTASREGDPKDASRREVFDAATAAKIEAVVAALKRGDNGDALGSYCDIRKPFERWLGTVVTKGQSRRDDVICLLGEHHANLDRPQRDKLLTLQYELGDWGHTVYLVFHFDADTGFLTNWSISEAICGFCPHVFVYDGRWRLEGKLLAGCVGRHREGSDTLRLPRGQIRDGEVRLKLANLAPEIEYIDQVKLGCVFLKAGEELDVAPDGTPIAWRADRQVPGTLRLGASGQEKSTLQLAPGSINRVLVLEAFNTSQFETAMRESLLGKGSKIVSAGLRVRFDQGAAIEVEPVGSKFLRRIVLRIPGAAQTVYLSAPSDFWFIRRMWTGWHREVEREARWYSPSAARVRGREVTLVLSDVDRQRLRLDPGEEAEVAFTPGAGAGRERLAFVLRMRGYYEFLPRER